MLEFFAQMLGAVERRWCYGNRPFWRCYSHRESLLEADVYGVMPWSLGGPQVTVRMDASGGGEKQNKTRRIELLHGDREVERPWDLQTPSSIYILRSEVRT